MKTPVCEVGLSTALPNGDTEPSGVCACLLAGHVSVSFTPAAQSALGMAPGDKATIEKLPDGSYRLSLNSNDNSNSAGIHGWRWGRKVWAGFRSLSMPAERAQATIVERAAYWPAGTFEEAVA